MAAAGAGPSILDVTEVTCTPFEGQKPGTSGLRKPTKVFMTPHYLETFVAAIFQTCDLAGATLVVSGDGRYFVPEACQTIARMAAAYGVARVWIGQGGILSTPAVSAIIREREGGVAAGGILLTASHNPGGIDGDFGVKYNVGNGGPAPERVTDAIYQHTQTMTSYKICNSLPAFNLDRIGATTYTGTDGRTFVVEIISRTDDYIGALSRVFNFRAISAFLKRPDFRFVFDGLSGVAGAYAPTLFCEVLGAPYSSIRNCVPKPDFGGHHPDPNLVYAAELVHIMGLKSDGTPIPGPGSYPDFGAACDGDADRNMVLGNQFFVTPSDSLAVIAANASAIPFFAGGLRGVARSMPTSAAVDHVAKQLGLPFFEVPTGWKFFGNLMDSTGEGKTYTPFLCGEESFGTGSNHVREKDGLWAVLAWLSILAARNAAVPVGSKLISVGDIVRAHWKQFGRTYYCRYDYENMRTETAQQHMKRVEAYATDTKSANHDFPELGITNSNIFDYLDPVDRSMSKNQGIRFWFADGSRVVFRLSGTGSSGATIRVYMERHETNPDLLELTTAEALASTVAAATRLADLTIAPSVIT